MAEFERDEMTSLAQHGLRFEEAEQFTAALLAQIAPTQIYESRRVLLLLHSLKAHEPQKFLLNAVSVLFGGPSLRGQ